MADDDLPPPIRLMNFVSEDQLKEARSTRGARVEDGTAQRDRSLYEILKENKDKKDAEFNERFKHRPPKALDEDETEFLDKLEMSKKEYEQQMAEEEERQLRSFQAAVASQSSVIHELKETPMIPTIQDQNSVAGRKNPSRHHPLGMIIKVKKAKVESSDSEEKLRVAKATRISSDEEPKKTGEAENAESLGSVAFNGLVSYSSEESDEDE